VQGGRVMTLTRIVTTGGYFEVNASIDEVMDRIRSGGQFVVFDAVGGALPVPRHVRREAIVQIFSLDEVS
jgi:hypothetical protein